MANTFDKFLEFALIAWNHRDLIMQAKTHGERVSRVYRYYFYYESEDVPDWCVFLNNFEQEFNGCSGTTFKFQSSDIKRIRGSHLANFAASINDILNNNSALLASLKTLSYTNRDSLVFDEQTRTFRAAKNDHEAAHNDPTFMLGQFLWHYGPTDWAHAQYRIYITPRISYCPKVFCDLVRYMDMPRPPGFDFPSSLKMLIPGPYTHFRADKIVMYCNDHDQIKGGIGFLRDYQKYHSGLFENFSPRSTKQVEGLRGVAVTPQPKPKMAIMNIVGQTNKTGMSFGMSRSAVIYLAMLENHKKGNSFKYIQACHKIAFAANLDLKLEGSDLEL